MYVRLSEEEVNKRFGSQIALQHYYVVDGTDETYKLDEKDKKEVNSDSEDTIRCFSLYANTLGDFGVSWMSYFRKNLEVNVHTSTNLKKNSDGC